MPQLAQDIQAFLVFKHALGYPYVRGEATLRSFERFVHQHAEPRSKILLETMLNGWLSRIDGRKPVTIALDLGVIRQFCLYRRRYEPRSFVPGREWAPQSAESIFLPYIFSHDEVRQILDAASQHHGRNLEGVMLRTLLLILYCTGLRLGEAVHLLLKDVDLVRNLFTVWESKGKTRFVPFGNDLARELDAYLSWRRGIATSPEDDALLVRLSGDALPVKVASGAIRQLLRREGLKPTKGRIGPRPYDMRHTFAVHRLTDWYRQGLDIHARLPWLSAYMGHDNVLGTEVYLTATAELMALASQRFEQRLQHARKK